MSKNLYTVLVSFVEHKFATIRYEIISVEKRCGDKKITDPVSGVERIEKEDFIRLEVEIPRGNGTFSRVRIKVKLLFDEFPISDAELNDDEIFTCVFRNLKVSYVASTSDHTFFFKADGCRIYRDDETEIYKEI